VTSSSSDRPHWHECEGYAQADSERWATEPLKGTGRTEFQRDRARVLHSSALRRLAAKTQIVRAGSGDFPRTRLTHSLECAQIGRELGALLGCDPDLVDAACLAHDIGHPPFGHNGETALARLADPGGELACGGFEGNAQSLRILTRLEPKVPGTGLNLTRATLDAALKYPWVAGFSVQPHSSAQASVSLQPPDSLQPPKKYGAYECDLPVFEWIRAGAPAGRRCLEAQVMDWADDVAYSVHDVEDGLHAGLVSLNALRDSAERVLISQLARDAYCKPEWAVPVAELEEVFTDFLALPFWDFSFDGGYAALVAAKTLTSELVGRFCGAAYRATLDARLSAFEVTAPPGTVTIPATAAVPGIVSAPGIGSAPGTPAASGIVSAPGPLAAPGDVAAPGTPAGQAAGASHATAFRLTRYAADLVVPRRQLLECALLKAVAARYVMGREGADAQQAGERELIAELALAIYRGAPAALDPVLQPAWDAAGLERAPERARRRVVIDQVASLTDTSAIAWHRRLCS
jgi:dGTPase